MNLTFLHTADWQLGKPFASIVNETKRYRLQQERVNSIQRIASKITEINAAFVVIAGDLFDSPHVTKSTVSSACAAIGLLTVPVFVIPGNHDHGGPGSIWEQEFFLREQRQLAPNLHILLKPEPVILENTAILLPAPLLRRHEPGNPISWIRQALQSSEFPDHLPRIVLAHGTVQGFTSLTDDEDGPTVTNWIDLSSLPVDDIDYIALGDWHGTKQVAPKAWYSGTPEIDRFPKGGENDPGNVLKVRVDRGQAPQVERISTSGFSWKEHSFRFFDDSGLELFSSELDELIGQNSATHLLRLLLEGSLGITASSRLETILESWESRLIRLKLDSKITIAPSAEEIANLTRRMEDPLISTVATELVSRSQGDTEEAAIARLALSELHSALL